MLPEIAAEALLFLPRRELDKASAVSKWLDALIAQCCEVYPLRPVDRIELRHNSHQKDCSTDVWFTDGRTTSFSSMDEAAHFAGLILRHSYVDDFQLVCTVDSMRLSSGHWTTLVDAMRVGSVDTLYFHRVDFSALDADALHVVAGCRGLQSLVAYESIVPSEFVTDSLIRSCAEGGLLRLRFTKRKGDAPFRLSEDALLDFLFAACKTHKELELQSDRVTDMFVQKFFERLLSSPVRPSGSLELLGGTKAQRGLSTYARYRVPGQDGAVLHRFPQTDGSDDYYSVWLSGTSSWMSMSFHLGKPRYF